jgi:hypothetical protein
VEGLSRKLIRPVLTIAKEWRKKWRIGKLTAPPRLAFHNND